MDTSKNKFGLNYTDLTHEDILEKINAEFAKSEKFKNYQNSDVGMMMAEMFSGIYDLLNFNVERTAEESFIHTSKRYRSVTKHADGLSYDIQRATPARGVIKLKVSGTSTLKQSNNTTDDFLANRVMIIPKNTLLSFDGDKFVLTDDVKYIFSIAEIARLRRNEVIEISISNNANHKNSMTILQGESKLLQLKYENFKNNFSIDGNGNSYQKYYINDKSFSNFYGENDPFANTTIVSVGETYLSSLTNGVHSIYRHSLITGKEIDSRSLRRAAFYNGADNGRTVTESNILEYGDATNNIDFKKSVWVKTSSDINDGQGIELKFGDGVSTSKGCVNNKESVFVQYFSTKGSSGNKYGVIGKELKFSNTSDFSWNPYLTLTAVLESNIVGGGDIESIESIKNSAPGMFQTFDRLVTKKDYVEFLKTLTSPIDVKNAIAWGEQDELISTNYHNNLPDNANQYAAIRKLFNVVLYTVVGSLYETYTNSKGEVLYRPRTNMHNAMLDNYSSNVIFPSQNYITIISQQEVVKQLKLENKLIDGSVPVEDFRFEIANSPISEIKQSSFYNFMKNVGVYKNNNLPSASIDMLHNSGILPAVISTVPFTMKVKATNPTSNDILDLDVEFSSVLGKELHVNTLFNLDSPTTDDIGFTKINSASNSINFDNTSYDNINYEYDITKNIPIFDTVITDSGIIGKPYLMNYDFGIGDELVNSGENAIKSYDNLLLTGRDEFNKKYKYAANSYARDFYKRLSETMNNSVFSSERMFGLYNSDVKDNYDILDNTKKIVDFNDFIDNQIFSWTPWGNIIKELENKLNYNFKKSLNIYDTVEQNNLINNHKFFNLVANIEENNSNSVEYDGLGYIRRLSQLESDTSFSTKLIEDINLDYIAVKNGGDNYIRLNSDITGTKFSLLNQHYNYDDSSLDINKHQYKESFIYSLYVYDSIDTYKKIYNLNPGETFEGITVEDFIKDSGLEIINDNLTTQEREVVLQQELLSVLIANPENLVLESEDSYNILETSSGIWSLEIAIASDKHKRYLSYNPLDLDENIVEEQKKITYLKAIGWDGLTVYNEGSRILLNNKCKKVLAEEFKLSLRESFIKKMQIIDVTSLYYNGVLIEEPYNYIRDLAKAQTGSLNDFAVMLYDSQNRALFNKFFKDIELKMNAQLNSKVIIDNYSIKEYNGRMYMLTLSSINQLLNVLGKVSNTYHEQLVNSYRFRSGDNYKEPIQIIGTYNNLPSKFDNNNNVINTGTDYSNITFELIPNYEYLDYDVLVTKKSNEAHESVINNLLVDELPYSSFSNVKTIKYNPYRFAPVTDVVTWRLINHATDIAKTTYYSPLVVDGVSINAANKVKKDLIDGLPTWFGYNDVSFTSYYTTNEVNVPNNKYTDKISICNDRMKDKNLTTVKTIYLSPILHQFELVGTINIANLSDITILNNKISSELYKFLDEYNDFGTPLYVSNLIEIIESFPEVINANVKLLPYNNKLKIAGQNNYFDIDSFLNGYQHPIYSIIPDESDHRKFRDIIQTALRDYISKYELNTSSLTADTWYDVPYNNSSDRVVKYELYPSIKTINDSGISKKHIFEYHSSSLSKGITERSFLNELCRSIINETEKAEILSSSNYLITKHKLFFILLADIHNDFLPIIEYNMLNSNGDIEVEYGEEMMYKNGEFSREVLRGGYSLNNEIIQVHINTNIKYKGN